MLTLKNTLDHYLNPLHIIYVPLRKIGISKKYALKFSRMYEEKIFKYYKNKK